MEITLRDLMTVIHGMLFGIFFVMVVFGLVIALCRHMFERGEPRVTKAGLRWEVAYLIVMAVLGWAAVLSGAYIVYPWYRAIPPAGVTNLAHYPQFFLKSSPTTAKWHSFGMEWKEHIAWMAPLSLPWWLMSWRSTGELSAVTARSGPQCWPSLSSRFWQRGSRAALAHSSIKPRRLRAVR